ncbi:MAG: trypsin-like peptidase domain-containing protein, partial [Pirellulales bacterium]
PVTVELLDGRTFPVRSIHAHDRGHDLAILKIDADGLPALSLAPADSLVQGQALVAFGNPQGLQHSVVTGIVSALREEIDGQPMIQLAIPIEQGNSGGPAVDLEGRVHGLLTLKSLVTDNLGYAVVADALRPLLDEPNPIPMQRWLTIGVLNPKYWQAAQDAVRWTQRAGHIRAEGMGSQFGGRSLCLSTRDLPQGPFEVAVTVKMNEEDGAAGLVFHSDGGDRHYGFYPSSGQLRFSRFDGATVYEWHVLREARTEHYRPGDWNRIKVRVDGGRFQCFCNDEQVFEIQDQRYASGKVGLAKFRHTTAEFKAFALGDELLEQRADPEIIARLTELVDDIAIDRPPAAALIDGVEQTGLAGRRALDERAQLLERQAQRLRELSRAVHVRQVREDLRSALQPDDGGDGNLLRAALLLALLDNDELHGEIYTQAFHDLADEFVRSLP